MRFRLGTRVVLGLLALSLSPTFSHAGDENAPIAWKKTVIEGKFRSEGVGIGDVNKDGKLDVLIGDSWYEAPAGPNTTFASPAILAMASAAIASA